MGIWAGISVETRQEVVHALHYNFIAKHAVAVAVFPIMNRYISLGQKWWKIMEDMEGDPFENVIGQQEVHTLVHANTKHCASDV